MAHMHIYGGIHGGGGGNTTFGGFVFASTGQPVSGKSKDKTSTTVTSPVKITFKSSRDRKYNEIRGKVQQLFKDKAHHGEWKTLIAKFFTNSIKENMLLLHGSISSRGKFVLTRCHF